MQLPPFDGIWLLIGVFGFAQGVWELVQRRSAGAVLLDLGRNRANVWASYVLVALFAGRLLTIMLRFSGHPLLEGLGDVGIIFGLVTSATRSFQIREAGLVGRGASVLRWEKLKGYALSPVGSLSFQLKDHDRWRFYGDVSTNLRAQAENVLASKCACLKT